MVVVPAPIPVTVPVDEPIVAIKSSPDDQIPPPEPESVEVEPIQACVVPEIEPGTALTVTCAVAIQPVARVYVIVELPADTPVNVPLVEPIVATAMLPLVHVPPKGVALNVVVDPAHTTAVPVIGPGVVFTVTSFVAKHPPESV